MWVIDAVASVNPPPTPHEWAMKWVAAHSYRRRWINAAEGELLPVDIEGKDAYLWRRVAYGQWGYQHAKTAYADVFRRRMVWDLQLLGRQFIDVRGTPLANGGKRMFRRPEELYIMPVEMEWVLWRLDMIIAANPSFRLKTRPPQPKRRWIP